MKSISTLLVGASLFIAMFWGVTAEAAESPRLGLALAGGGAKGFAHIGVLKVLEEADVPVDVISGTSMGAVVGSLYAMGYTAQQIEAIALETDWEDLFDDRIPRGRHAIAQMGDLDRYLISLPMVDGSPTLPAGLIAGQKISSLFARLMLPAYQVDDFTTLPIPLACVATDIATGETVALTRGSLPEAVRASMAIPSAFTPVPWGEHLLVDGMLGRNLPARDALDLGADVVIGVDLGADLVAREELTDLITILGQASNLMGAQSVRQQRDLCRLVIEPELADYEATDFNRAAAIIAVGERAARAVLPELQRLVAEHGRRGERPLPPPLTVPVAFDLRTVTVHGLKQVEAEYVLAACDLALPATVDLGAIEAAVQRVYATGMFERVTYRLEPQQDGLALSIDATEKSLDQFRFGMRYDTIDKLSAVFGLLLRNKLANSSQLSLDAMVGDRSEILVRHRVHLSSEPGLSLSTRLGYQDEELDRYLGKLRVAKYDVDALSVQTLVTGEPARRLQLGAGARAEWVELEPDVLDPGFETYSEHLVSLVGQGIWDSRDRTDFARRGVRVVTRHDWFVGGVPGGGSASRHLLDVWAAVPMVPGVSGLLEVASGACTGDALPVHAAFVLGGASSAPLVLDREFLRLSFPGLNHQQLAGANFHFGQAGLQVDLGRHTLVRAVVAAGRVMRSWSLGLANHRYEVGGGLTLGMLTPLGPVSVTASYGSAEETLWSWNVGMRF